MVLAGAYYEFRASPDETLFRQKSEIESFIDLNIPYAVRSSANIEDQADYSFAGQFKRRNPCQTGLKQRVLNALLLKH